jgi:hypothetical protein
MKTKDNKCFFDCKYLSITEYEQENTIDGKKMPHICNLFNKQVKHENTHPFLTKIDECEYDGSELNSIEFIELIKKTIENENANI